MISIVTFTKSFTDRTEPKIEVLFVPLMDSSSVLTDVFISTGSFGFAFSSVTLKVARGIRIFPDDTDPL